MTPVQKLIRAADKYRAAALKYYAAPMATQRKIDLSYKMEEAAEAYSAACEAALEAERGK